MTELLIDGKSLIEDPEIVLFDKDGTLIDIHHYWVSMIEIRASLIINRWFSSDDRQKDIELCVVESMGVDLRTGRIKADGPVGIKPRPYIVNIVSDVIRSSGINISNDQMEKLFLEADLNTSENLLPLLRLLPGAVELLERLKEHKIRMVIVSTDLTSRARTSLEVLGIARFFDEILGGDSVINTKPFPDLALNAIYKFHCNVRKAVVVGDHPVDIQMGKSAGVGLNIGVLTGLSEFLAFEGLGCVVIQDLNSIKVKD